MGSSALEQTRRAARLDEVIRGMLPATQERDRLGRRRTLACFHPTDRSRASVSTPQERPGHEARLAPEGTSRTSPYPRLLSCLCSLENPGPGVPTCRPWRRAAQDLRRTPTNLFGRCRAAHTRRRLDSQTMCQPPHRTSGNLAATPRTANPCPHRTCRNVVKTSEYPH